MDASDSITIRPAQRPVDVVVRLPGSKSLTNRALLSSALARGESELAGVLFADDTRLMIDALKALGAGIEIDEGRSRARVSGCGGRWRETEASLYCGNAGTVIRFLSAACSAGIGEYLLDGDARMRQRPIGDLVEALRSLGAGIGYAGAEGYCPLTVRAKGLRGGQVVISEPASSQFVSALLMAAPLAADDVLIEIAGALPSRPYVKMTLGVMEAFGIAVVQEGLARFVVPAPQHYEATHYTIEPDASAASYFFAAAAITGGRVTVEGLGARSVQGDWGFVRVLDRMGCRVDADDTGTTVVGPEDGKLRGLDVDLGDMPDVAQTLAVLAAFADGPTRIRNVANLRIKETDRLNALATELGRMGVDTEIHADGITIRPDRPPTAAPIRTYHDHRMAMSFALAGLRLDGMVISDPTCVSKTFPTFFETWGRLTEQ